MLDSRKCALGPEAKGLSVTHSPSPAERCWVDGTLPRGLAVQTEGLTLPRQGCHARTGLSRRGSVSKRHCKPPRARPPRGLCPGHREWKTDVRPPDQRKAVSLRLPLD